MTRPSAGCVGGESGLLTPGGPVQWAFRDPGANFALLHLTCRYAKIYVIVQQSEFIMAHVQAPQLAPVPTGDTELVRRARLRDETAVRAIIKDNNRRLYRLARGILRNDSEAEDVVQETYVRAFTHLDSFRGNKPCHLAGADRHE